MNISYNDIVNCTPEEKVQVNILKRQTRTELRELANILGVKRGRDKNDTIINLIRSGKFEIRLGLTSKAIINVVDAEKWEPLKRHLVGREVVA